MNRSRHEAPGKPPEGSRPSQSGTGAGVAPIKLGAGFLTVGAWTLLSRALGFVRDVLILSWLGTGPAYEAFVVAFRLPNMFRRLFAEGAFNAAFVPMFAKRLETGGARGGGPPGEARAFAEQSLSALAAVLVALTLVAQLAMPWLIWAMASGFTGQDQFGLAVEFGRIAFPYILFISVAALLSGALNAMNRFAAAAAAPVLLNAFLIAAMALAAYSGADVARALVWAIPIAGAAQLALVWIAAERAGLSLRPRLPRWSPELGELARIAVPAALAGGVVQVNLLVGQQVASHFDRAVGWLYAADRLYQLPLGVVGIAIGIVLLPDLSRKLAVGDAAGGSEAMSRAGEMALALTLPAAVALAVVPLPIVSVLFERGATTAEDSRAIAVALAIYGAGLPAFVLQKVLQPAYFARSDTRTPFRYAVNAMVLNAVLAVGLATLVDRIGWLAPAIAASVAGWAMVWQLARGARRMGAAARFDARFRDRAWKCAASAAIMGIFAWVLARALEPWLFAPGVRYPALAVLVAGSAGTYFAVASLTGGLRIAELRNAIRRK